MSDERERGADIIEAHQELVSRLERSAARMKALSVVTVFVAAILAVSYLSQLALPLAGVSSVTVSLVDPGTVALEVVVLVLTVVWLYVGARDFRYASKVGRQIARARSKEDELKDRVLEGPTP